MKKSIERIVLLAAIITGFTVTPALAEVAGNMSDAVSQAALGGAIASTVGSTLGGALGTDMSAEVSKVDGNTQDTPASQTGVAEAEGQQPLAQPVVAR
jgi:phage tail tape-measure protein